MHNVAPSVALVRRSRRLLQLAFVVVSGGAFLASVGLALFVVTLAVPSNPGYGLYITIRNLLLIGGILVVLVGVGLAIRALTWKTDSDLAQITGEFLRQHFDQRYTFIRNVSKRQIGYVDAVLVGPPGVLVFRLLNNEGVFFNEASRWLKQKAQDDWVPMRLNPTKETVDDIQRLRDFLIKHNLDDVPVFGVIVFLKETPTVQLSVENPVVPPVQLPWLVTALQDNYLAKDRIDERAVAAVVRLLYDT